MADTFSSALKARKIEQGGYDPAWAATFNAGLVDILDAAINGRKAISVGSSTSYSLAALQNGTLSDSHYWWLAFTGTPASAVTVTVPASVTTKEYLIDNQTGQEMIVKYAATSGVIVKNGTKLRVLCDGTTVVEANATRDDGVFTRYLGSVASSAGTNTTALQDTLDNNQTVEIHDSGTHNFNDTIIFNTNNRIVGKGSGTILKWNVTSKSLFKGLSAATTRLYSFGLYDLTIDGTSRDNAGVIALDLDNLSLGDFRHLIVQNVETGLKLYSSRNDPDLDGAYYNKFDAVSWLTVDDGIVIAGLGNENQFDSCRVGVCANGVIGDDSSGNFFNRVAIESFTSRAVDLGASAPALYYCFNKPRIEDGPTGFRLDNADARSTTIVAPHFQTISGSNFDASAIGLDTLVLSGEINSPELRTNVLALGQGGLNNSQWAIIKAAAASDVYCRNATDSGWADFRASDIYAARFFRTAGPASGAASTVTLGNATQSTVGAAGGASALPATPSGYLRFFVGTTEFVIPYFAQA